MFFTKDGDKALERFVEDGGAMAMFACETLVVTCGEELKEMGIDDPYQSTVAAIAAAIGRWSVDVCNQFLAKIGDCCEQTNVFIAQDRIIKKLMEDWKD